MAYNSHRNARMELLDRALAGKPAEVKSRVLDLILRLGIDPEDEFWLIFVALGHLQVLIEDSPNDWQALFVSFEEELRQWELKNMATLAHLARQVETMEGLADSAKKLTFTLHGLLKVCEELTPALRTSTQASQTSLKELRGSLDLLDGEIGEVRIWMQAFLGRNTNQSEKIDYLLKILEQVNARLKNQNIGQTQVSTFNASFFGGFLGAAFALLVVQFVLSHLFVRF